MKSVLCYDILLYLNVFYKSSKGYFLVLKKKMVLWLKIFIVRDWNYIGVIESYIENWGYGMKKYYNIS